MLCFLTESYMSPVPMGDETLACMFYTKTALVMDGKWTDNEPRFLTALGYEKFYLVGDKVVIKLPDVHHGDIFSCGLSPVLLEGSTTCHVPQKTGKT